MGNTAGKQTQQTLSTDLEIFVGASEFKDVAGLATLASAGEGLLSLNLSSTQAATFFANLTAFLRRTGEYATAAGSQRQYGTAASVPGPSTVANTSGPLALPVGFPPIVGSKMATLAGGLAGPTPKGMQINSMDVIYEVDTVNASLATCSLTETNFANAASPVVTSLITLGANGLPVAFGTSAKPYVTNVAVTTPALITVTDTEVIAHVNLTAGSGGTAKFYGVNLKVSYNLN
jgi:hypothetical protein